MYTNRIQLVIRDIHKLDQIDFVNVCLTLNSGLRQMQNILSPYKFQYRSALKTISDFELVISVITRRIAFCLNEMMNNLILYYTYNIEEAHCVSLFPTTMPNLHLFSHLWAELKYEVVIIIH